MTFTNDFPRWENEGASPPEAKKDVAGGWEPEERPPASWFNWFWSEVYKAGKETQEAHEAHLLDYASVADKTYYLDQASGNDSNDGLTAGTAFATWEKVASMIPGRLAHDYEIQIIGGYTGDIFLGGKVLTASNKLVIRGSTTTPGDHILSGAVDIGACSGDINFVSTIGVVLRYVRTTNALKITGSSGVHILDCEPRRSGGAGVLVRSSQAFIENCDFGTDDTQDCINAQLSRVLSLNNSGNGTRYGLASIRGATISKDGTQPTGTTLNEYTTSGGVINPIGESHSSEDASSDNVHGLRENEVALGANSIAGDDDCISIGRNAETGNDGAGDGLGQIAIGDNATTKTDIASNIRRNIAIGSAAEAKGASAVALGQQATAGGNQGLALGRQSNVSHANSSAIGYLAETTATQQIMLGRTGDTVTTPGTFTADNIKRSAGSPEGSVTGKVGDFYQRTDGGTDTTLYVKEDGTGNTGWVAK